MFSFLKKKKVKPNSIRIKKIYDGVKFKDEIISGPPKQTKKTLDDIVANPKRYAYHFRKTDTLSDTPKIKIEILSQPKLLEDTELIAEITLTHNTVMPKPKMGFVAKAFIFLTILSVFSTFPILYVLQKESEQVKIDSQCYHYSKEGVPQSIHIGDRKYQLDENGKLDPIDEAFFNPWHRKALENCVKIDTRR